MKFNQHIQLRLLSLAVGVSLLAACHSQPQPTANAPSATPPNGATAATPPANANAALATTATSNTATSVTPSPQGGQANCETCWVHIFDDKNFKATDDNHKICGPGAWPNLRNLAGAAKINWGDEIESLRVGPGATVVVWTGEQFTGASHTFPAGTEKLTLKDLPGFSDGISSIEIKCQ